MAANPILYYFNRSPPCRAVTMAAKAIGIDLQLKTTQNSKGENMTPQFLKVKTVLEV